MSRYRTGARAEYKLKHELEKNGWHVIRAAGSHGKWDLVAVRRRNGRLDILLLIQVKRKQKPPTRPVISIYPNSTAVDCFIFVVPRQGAFLSRDLQFSASNSNSVFRQLSGEQQEAACHRSQEHTTRGHHDCRNESTRTHRKRACSR